ncbi:MAG: C_GCAxxG_C_C family protein [Bacteroidaceae bacterium]|nr:C_GCAxxG_C_C family protein [Bacteroidaceae bacterium]
MNNKVKSAVEKKQTGKYNCAQAVACSFCEYAQIGEQDIRHAALGLGAGMGSMEGTCGALTGAGLIIGLVCKEDKPRAMGMSRTLMNKFLERNGTTQCKQLKGVGTGKAIRSCDDCVADAAEFLDEILKTQ